MKKTFGGIICIFLLWSCQNPMIQNIEEEVISTEPTSIKITEEVEKNESISRSVPDYVWIQIVLDKIVYHTDKDPGLGGAGEMYIDAYFKVDEIGFNMRYNNRSSTRSISGSGTIDWGILFFSKIKVRSDYALDIDITAMEADGVLGAGDDWFGSIRKSFTSGLYYGLGWTYFVKSTGECDYYYRILVD